MMRFLFLYLLSNLFSQFIFCQTVRKKIAFDDAWKFHFGHHQFDVIGESYYPKWHGTLDDLRNNLTDLVSHYKKPVIVVEYSQLKKEVADIVFNLPNYLGKGTCIWEPLNTWEAVFDKDGKSNNYINLYDELQKEYLKSKFYK